MIIIIWKLDKTCRSMLETLLALHSSKWALCTKYTTTNKSSWNWVCIHAFNLVILQIPFLNTLNINVLFRLSAFEWRLPYICFQTRFWWCILNHVWIFIQIYIRYFILVYTFHIRMILFMPLYFWFLLFFTFKIIILI